MFLDALFRRYQWLMYREIYQITDNPWDTEDVIQMVWVKLLDKVSLLRSRDTTRLVNYIIAGYLQNVIIDLIIAFASMFGVLVIIRMVEQKKQPAAVKN